MPKRAMLFIAATAALGIVVLLDASLHWSSQDLLRFACYLVIGIIAGTMKVRLPEMDSTMSVHFLFVLLGALELSMPETLVIGCAAALVQSLWKPQQKPDPVKVLFNVVCMTAPTVYLTYFLYHWSAAYVRNSTPMLLLIAALTYFLVNTLLVAFVIALNNRSSLRGIWKATYFWALPYYLIGAAVVGLIHLVNGYFGWQNGLLVLPIMYLVYRSYNLYLGRLDDEKKRVQIEAAQVEAEKRHVEEVCALHLRTIEGLALAIEAKDHVTSNHLNRVRTYAEELGKDLGLEGEELDALRAAALLHDIGKLAVPDQIINKPGRLTPEEFEKMKIHPAVGAEILERVAFPYPVAPIVRSHHEKWNGKGYPDGLKGEEIPIGARILSAVDCLDRQYRKALPLDEAMKVVADQSGEAFDPRVVQALQLRYVELENMAVSNLDVTSEDTPIYDQVVERGDQPDAGFAKVQTTRPSSQTDFLASIASARQEAHTLFELSQDLGNSLSLDETLSLFAMRLRKLVPYDSIVIFLKEGDLLRPEFANGNHFRLLLTQSIPVGNGLCGWVAENCKAIVNGNPEVDFSFGKDASEVVLRSALAVPLEGVAGVAGVLALYQEECDGFTNDHLRILQALTTRVALFIENALKYREAETSATIDFLTGLANARSLYLHLEQEIARGKQENSTFAIMVCDLNGFKMINDRYGHLAGDKVLKTFAQQLRSACSEADYTARMSGDEFVIIAPDLSPKALGQKVSLLDDLARQAGIAICGEDCLSASVGAAFFPRDGFESERLLSEADRAMYTAKRHEASSRKPALVQVA
jgi:diguanylate cyclase (GGDEF)-like protein/putative nucleotidyltransferase with HDIG domain